jgi:uncharacterized protein (TIGR00369 family)
MSHRKFRNRTGGWKYWMVAADALQSLLSRVPVFKGLQLRMHDVAEGSASLTLDYDHALTNIFNNLHGGLLATLADTAAWVAVLTLAGADAWITTTDMNIRFLAPCRSDATAVAKVIKFGKTLCPVSVDLRDGSGKQVAVAQATYIRLAGPAKQ